MNIDPGIVCYEHCKRGRHFSYSLPEFCHFCNADLRVEPLLFEAFRLPCPFVRASQVPCCLVIKPRSGNFLDTYERDRDLHIGLTNSEGRVYEYGNEGLLDDNTTAWDQCIPIPILSGSRKVTPDRVWREYWDFTVEALNRSLWTEEKYSEDAYNCFTFVLEFLKALRPPNVNVKNLTKTIFCHLYISPQTSPAGKYISIYRQLTKSSIVLLHRTHLEPRPNPNPNDKSHLPVQLNVVSTTECS